MLAFGKEGEKKKKSIVENCLLQTLEFIFHRLLLNTKQAEDDKFEQSRVIACLKAMPAPNISRIKKKKSHF